jgi:60 kDa SS-A/Ro ribonucleoprotein
MRFNTVKESEAKATATRNHEGGLAFNVSPELELVLRSATCLVEEPKFYGKTGDTEIAIKEIVAKVATRDPEFILQLAAYARNELYLRSLPQMLMIEAMQYQQCKQYVKAYAPLIMKRADEITESLAYFIAKNGKIGTEGKASLPHCYRDALVAQMCNLTEYEVGKYKAGNKKEVTFKDVLRLVHPVPMDVATEKLFKAIINDTVEIPETWETYISANGSTKETWEHIIPKMGYMALLRNLRNFVEKKVSIHYLDMALDKLANDEEIAKSKQFPFRFLSASRELSKVSDANDPFILKPIQKALNYAIETSVKNVPRLKGRTFILVDNSGSMDNAQVSRMSSVNAKEVAGVMGALAYKISKNPIVGVFAETFKIVDIDGMRLLDAAEKISSTDVGGSTYAYKGIEYLHNNAITIDRIILLSDMQCYNEADAGYYVYGTDEGNSLYKWLTTYRRSPVGKNATLISIDLRGYGTTQFPEHSRGVALVAGWSDRIFQFINIFEQCNSNTFIEEIKNYRK